MKAPTPSSPKKLKSHTKKNKGEDDTTSIDSEEENYNLMLEKFFKLEDRLASGIQDLRQKDNEHFVEFMTQIKRFNQKLDLSLKYFLDNNSSQNAAINGPSASNNRNS